MTDTIHFAVLYVDSTSQGACRDEIDIMIAGANGLLPFFDVTSTPTPIAGVNYVIDSPDVPRPLTANTIAFVADAYAVTTDWLACAYYGLDHAIAYKYLRRVGTADDKVNLLCEEILHTCEMKGWCENYHNYHNSPGFATWVKQHYPTSGAAASPYAYATTTTNMRYWIEYLGLQVLGTLAVGGSASNKIGYTVVVGGDLADYTDAKREIVEEACNDLWFATAARTHPAGDYSSSWLRIDYYETAYDRVQVYLDGADYDADLEGLHVCLRPNLIAIAERDVWGDTPSDLFGYAGPWPGNGGLHSVSVTYEAADTAESLMYRIWYWLLQMQHDLGHCEDPATQATSDHFEAWCRVNYPAVAAAADIAKLWYVYLNEQVIYGFTPSTQPSVPSDPAPSETGDCDFVASATRGTAPLTVTLTDTSTANAVAWHWIVHTNGNYEQTSTSQNPTFTLTFPGNYCVSLWVRTATNEQFLESKLDYIRVVWPRTEPPVTPWYCYFSASATGGTSPFTITVTDASKLPGSINNPIWVWGDASTPSTGLTATHTYVAPGTYTLEHTVFDGAGVPYTDSISVIVSAGSSPPTTWFRAGFAAGPQSGPAPLTVNFTDQSAVLGGVQQSRWWFGDGSAMSSDVNSVHTYTAIGKYKALHWVCGTDGIGYSTWTTIAVTGTTTVPGTPPEDPDPPTTTTTGISLAVGDRVLWIPALNVVIPLV